MRSDDDLEREIRAHLEQEARERREEGTSEAESIYAARLRQCHAGQGGDPQHVALDITRAVLDLRHGARLMAKNPA